MESKKLIEGFQARVNALQDEAEKKAGEKKLKALKAEIDGFERAEAELKGYANSSIGQEHFKRIETIIKWTPGKINREVKDPKEVANEIFGTSDMVYTRTIMLVSDVPFPADFGIPGMRMFSKDSDKTRVNYRYEGKPEIIKRDGEKLILDRNLLESAKLTKEEE
jgi:hypothetical protein